LSDAVGAYAKQAGSVIDMADSDAGAALMFVVNAERSFAQFQKLVEGISERSNDLREPPSRFNLDPDLRCLIQLRLLPLRPYLREGRGSEQA